MKIQKISILLTTFLFHCESLLVEVKNFSVPEINDWVDMLIEGMQREIWSTDRVYIAIPDLQAETTRRLGKISLQFEIFARKGIFGGLVPLRRKKDVSVSTTNGENVIEFVVEVEQSGAHFDDCIIQCGPTKSLQELEILIPPTDNTLVTVQLSVKHDSQLCQVRVDHVKVEEFENITIAIDNQCVFSELEMFQQWILDYFNSHVCSTIASTFSSVLSKLLKQHNICRMVKQVQSNKLPLFHI